MKKIIVNLIKPIVYLFYDRKYLIGKYFNELRGGWLWALRGILWQKIFGFNKHIPWPVSPFVVVQNAKNIEFDMADINIFQSPGCYFQNNFGGKIYIGKGTYIAPNCGLITSNHDVDNLEKHSISKDIKLGERCWLGMNVVILPGVKLGNNTIVGAGAVVTKSFPQGNCIIAGNPAKLIKVLEVKGNNE